MRLLYVLFLLLCLCACGAYTKPRQPTHTPQEQPATVLPSYPECFGAERLAYISNTGCTERCLPRTVSRVCTDLGSRVYVPATEPLITSYVSIVSDLQGHCAQGYDVLQVGSVKHYSNRDFEWVTFPKSGEPCVIDAGQKVWGWFDEVYGTLDFYEFELAILTE